jgi:hypothetical protein
VPESVCVFRQKRGIKGNQMSTVQIYMYVIFIHESGGLHVILNTKNNLLVIKIKMLRPEWNTCVVNK